MDAGNGERTDDAVPDGDELAGIAEQFGALTRAELLWAAEEVAFRDGREFDEAAVDEAIDRALDRLRLVAFDGPERRLLAAGPAAFPRLPAAADRLPHVLDISERSVDRAVLVEAATRRLRGAAARAVDEADRDRMTRMVDATYDLEAWAPEADAGGVRERLDDALDRLDDRQTQ